jgi:hypothetical protein
MQARGMYAEDFGEPAAGRLEAYVHAQFEKGAGRIRQGG